MVPALGELPVGSVQAPGSQGCVGCQVHMFVSGYPCLLI